MTKETNREDRWFAYLLGELDRDASAAVEMEMKEYPEEAEATRAAFERTQAWAQRQVPHDPIQLDDLSVSGFSDIATKRSRAEAIRSRQGLLVAAAIFILALTQAQFSYNFSDSSFAWGADSVGDLPPSTESASPVDQLAETTKKVEALEQKSAETDRIVEALVLNSNYLAEALEQKTRELALSQQLESQARHRDMKRMISWTEYPGYVDEARNTRAAQQGGIEVTPAGNSR